MIRSLGRRVRCGRFSLARVMSVMASGRLTLCVLITGAWGVNKSAHLLTTNPRVQRSDTVLTIRGEHGYTAAYIAHQHSFPFSQGPVNDIAHLAEYRQQIALVIAV